MGKYSPPVYFRPCCQRANWRLGEFRCLQLFLFQHNCGRIQDGTTLFAIVEGPKLYGTKITLYTVMHYCVKYILVSVAARTRQSQLHSFSLVVSKLMMESLTITCNIFTEITNTAWNIENWKSFPSGVLVVILKSSIVEQPSIRTKSHHWIHALSSWPRMGRSVYSCW